MTSSVVHAWTIVGGTIVAVSSPTDGLKIAAMTNASINRDSLDAARAGT